MQYPWVVKYPRRVPRQGWGVSADFGRFDVRAVSRDGPKARRLLVACVELRYPREPTTARVLLLPANGRIRVTWMSRLLASPEASLEPDRWDRRGCEPGV